MSVKGKKIVLVRCVPTWFIMCDMCLCDLNMVFRGSFFKQ